MSRTYLAIADAFGDAECDRIIALADEAQTEAGPLYGDAERRVDRALRDVRSSLVARADAGWLFARLDALFALGAEAFGLPVGPVSETIQILLYGEGGHFRMWHTDAGADRGERRRISMSVELSDPAEYEGGALEVVPDLVGRARALSRGGAHLFPSRALHRVTPVTQGERWALVAWTGAPEG
jgi:PKHD-type hydroxylase